MHVFIDGASSRDVYETFFEMLNFEHHLRKNYESNCILFFHDTEVLLHLILLFSYLSHHIA